MTTEPCPPTLTLVGTVHRDRHGEAKLLSLLEQLSPSEITLEMSPSAFDYRRQQARIQLQRLEDILIRLGAELGRDPRELRDLPVVVDIHRLLELPFEYRAASTYAEKHRIPCDLIDISEISAAKLKKVERDLITYRNLRILIHHPPCEEPASPGCEEGYHSARAMVLEKPRTEVRRLFLDRRRGREGVGLRDRLMAEEIGRRMHRGRGGHLVHIGGWVHLVEDDLEETLFSRLRGFHPQRLLLEESLCPVEREGGSGCSEAVEDRSGAGRGCRIG